MIVLTTMTMLTMLTAMTMLTTLMTMMTAMKMLKAMMKGYLVCNTSRIAPLLSQTPSPIRTFLPEEECASLSEKGKTKESE